MMRSADFQAPCPLQLAETATRSCLRERISDRVGALGRARGNLWARAERRHAMTRDRYRMLWAWLRVGGAALDNQRKPLRPIATTAASTVASCASCVSMRN